MPEPTRRPPRKDALRNRERVLDAATELVRTAGEKVPMARIAEQAGVGVGTLYRHFPTREDLLAELVHRSFGIALENARAAAAHPGPAREGIRRFFLATLRDRDRFVLPLHGGPAVFTDATRQRQADVRVALRELIARGQAAGELRDDLTAEDLIVATSLLSRPLPGVGDWERPAHRQIDLMIDGLGPSAPPVLRPAAPGDVEAVARIWHEGWQAGHLGHVPEGLRLARTRASFRTRAEAKLADTTVAEHAGSVVGFVMVREDEVEQVYLDAAQRGSGMAATLLAEAERRVRAGGHDTAWLAVVAGNERARRFYAKRGWSDDGPFDYEAPGPDGPIRVPSRRYVKGV